MPEVIIAGAGLAGLACAKHLMSRGVEALVLEASDGVGGRVRTDRVDGFLLDRGFQVLLTAYPEAQATLDYAALELQPFAPGALVQWQGARHLLADPWRQPLSAWETLRSPIGTWMDKLRIGRMRYRALQARPLAVDTRAYLAEQGFSSRFIEQFFRPFFGGIFLERDFRTPAAMAEFVFRMMAYGDSSLPKHGMGEISRQLAQGLQVRLRTPVKSVHEKTVTLESGETLSAAAIVVAADGPAAARLAGVAAPASRGVSCLYYAADRAPVTEPLLVLNGDGQGPVNNFCVPSAVSAAYAPPGAALLAATVLGIDPDESAVREQLAGWFGPEAHTWRHLRTYRLAHAQPETNSGAFPPGWHICGDHRESASIQGALVSGRHTAERIIHELRK
ncbi:MAG: FAD-dependent oxidoreductase [Bryobacteraceae bacterium]|nr:FAD-dependent oxidoreductase [Bryobacteraceae bacterium]